MKDNRLSWYSYLEIICLVSFFLLGSVPVHGQISIYTNEKDYLETLASLGYKSFKEGFEEDTVWGNVRSPDSALSVTSQSLLWTSNHPQTNDISTSPGAAISGNWGIYDPVHGLATGYSQQCDVETPPSHCLFSDGLRGTVAPGMGQLSGIGGWFTGMAGAKIIVILNQTTEIELGKLGKNKVQFFGVIHSAGFTSFQLVEVEGKVGDKMLIFADDFTFGLLKP